MLIEFGGHIAHLADDGLRAWLLAIGGEDFDFAFQLRLR
jgi:hypothetical protein